MCGFFFFGSITYFSWVGYTPQAVLLVLGSNLEKHVFIMRPQRQSRNPHFFWTCTLVKVETNLSKFRWLRIPPRCGKQVKKKCVSWAFQGGLATTRKASCILLQRTEMRCNPHEKDHHPDEFISPPHSTNPLRTSKAAPHPASRFDAPNATTHSVVESTGFRTVEVTSCSPLEWGRKEGEGGVYPNGSLVEDDGPSYCINVIGFISGVLLVLVGF